jgi:Subtilase family/Bacterial Ig domain
MKLNLRSILVAALVISSASLLVGAQGQGGAGGPGLMSERARHQIEALMQEKATRSHGRRKMDSQLIYGIKMHRGERIADGVDTLMVRVPRTAAGEAIVDITANVGGDLLSKLRQAGAKILGAYPESHSVRAEIDLNALDTIADFPEITFIQPMQEAITRQGATSQGPDAPFDPEHLRTTRPEFDERETSLSAEVALMLEEFQASAYSVGIAGVRKSEADLTHRAAAARNTYGSDGTGIKIGVLSDGVRNLAASQASGDLGPVTVLPGQTGTSPGQCSGTASCDEGTAMLEIVHDIAPGAQLFFATAFGSSANFANNIRALRAAGCDIIVDDIFYFAESPFQDGQAPGIISPTNGGIIVQAVNDVTADGALYFSSAGNSGNKNDGTSGVWEGDFVDGGDAPAILGGAAAGRVHQFPGGLTFDTVTAVGSSQYNLNWSDPLGGSANDYDLYALNAAGTTVIAASTASQDGTQDPFEAIGPAPANSRLVIVKFSGDARYLRLTTNRGRLNVSTSGQTTGHSTAANAFGVAATPAIGPFPNPFTAVNQVETFSSDGPRKLFFQANGTPFTPGNVLAAGGISRQKPDITAADGVSVTGAGGFGISFFGTSAAAPHAAAIAALLKAANPSLTPAMVRDALQNTAIDNEGPGVDRDSGFGIIMADSALQFIGASPIAANVTLGTPTVSEVGGNANGFLEPGERGTLAVQLLNTGVAPAVGVTATLSSTTPGVTITPASTRSYPDLAATSGTSTTDPFEFVLQDGAAYAATISFVMTASYNGVTRSFPFSVPTGQLALLSSALDATAPAAGANYTATTGLQTSRMNFTFPISNCGTPKANPGVAASALTRRYDAYTFTNTSASPICATVLLTHSANALLYVDAYMPTFIPTSVGTNFAGDNGGSATSGAGTTQLFSFNVPAASTFVVVVSESNSGGAPNVPYNLRVTGLPASAVPANVAPVNSVPAPQTVLEDGTLVLSGANAISVSDADAGNNPVKVTLAAASGVVSLAGTAGLSFTNGTGSGDVTMTFTGSIAAINSALNGATYAPAANFNGAASITVTTDDRGNTGTGGAMSDTDTVGIAVTAVNDAPGFTEGGNQTVQEDAGPQSVPAWATGISAGPADESAQTLTFIVSSDNPALFITPPAIASDGTLTFTPAPNATGTATVTVVLMDGGGTTDGGVDTSTAKSFTITVTAVNDAPGFTSGASQTAPEDAGLRTVPAWATNISAGPADESGQAVSFVVTNDNNALFSIQPSVAADGTLTFRAAPDASGQAVVTVLLRDDGGTAGGGVDTSAPQTFTITITAVNDAPSFTAGANQTVPEDAGLRTVPAWATNISAGPANESAQTLAFVVTSNNAALFAVRPSVAPDGTLSFQSAPNANGQAIVTVVVKDNGGATGGGIDASAPKTFVITVTPVNDAPVLATIGSRTVVFGNLFTFTAAATDVDRPAQTLTFSLTGAVPDFAFIDKRTGCFFWLPWFTEVGHIYSFNVRVTDSQGAFDEETLTIPVVYSWSGFLSPNNGATYRAGKVVPVTFRLTGVSALIDDANARLFISRVVNGVAGPETPATPSGSAHGGNRFRFDDCEYVFNWDTKGLATGTYQLRVDLGDGVLRTTVIRLN